MLQLSAFEKTVKQKDEIRVFMAEDDVNWSCFLQRYLIPKGIMLDAFQNGESAWEAFQTGVYNFCITNINLEGIDGFTLTKNIRSVSKHIPIFFITEKSATDNDKIEAFKLGADDFISKPYNVDVITLMIKSIYKRFLFCPIEEDIRIFNLGKLSFDYNRQLLLNNETQIKLTTRESQLLFALCLNKGEILEREKALFAVWHNTEYFNSRSMDVYISKLRRLLDTYTTSSIINVHGVGFKLVTYDEIQAKEDTCKPAINSLTETETAES